MTALCGTLVCFIALTGCQSEPESTTDIDTSTGDETGATAPRTGSIQVGNPPNAIPPSIALLPGTETNAPTPLAEVTTVSIENHSDRTRVSYQLDGTGTVAWKVEAVSESIRAGDSTVVDVGGKSIIQVNLMGVTAPQPFPPIAASDGKVTGVATAAVSREIVQSFIGVSDAEPEVRASEVESPGQLVLDIFTGTEWLTEETP